MVEEGSLPRELNHFFVAPLAEIGKVPTMFAFKQPTELPIPLNKLLESVLARGLSRNLPAGKLSRNQYAYQRAGSTETYQRISLRNLYAYQFISMQVSEQKSACETALSDLDK